MIGKRSAQPNASEDLRRAIAKEHLYLPGSWQKPSGWLQKKPEEKLGTADCFEVEEQQTTADETTVAGAGAVAPVTLSRRGAKSRRSETDDEAEGLKGPTSVRQSHHEPAGARWGG